MKKKTARAAAERILSALEEGEFLNINPSFYKDCSSGCLECVEYHCNFCSVCGEKLPVWAKSSSREEILEQLQGLIKNETLDSCSEEC